MVALVALLAQLSFAQRLRMSTGGSALHDEQAILGAVQEGRYMDGLKLVKTAAARANVFGVERETINLYAAIALFWLEVGNLPQSRLALDAAKQLADSDLESTIARIPWEVDGQRARAALLLDEGEYEGAFHDAVDRYKKGAGIPLTKVGAYRFALAAQAQLRLGNVTQASELAAKALRFVPKKNKKLLLYVPRVLYITCLVEGYQGKFVEAEELCRRGLSLVETYGIQSRDVSLGYLALAEVMWLKRDLPSAREAAVKSVALTHNMFGETHQDLIEGLKLLSLIAAQEGKPEDAKVFARDARIRAAALFGEGSTGLRMLTQALKDSSASGSQLK